MKRFLFRVVCFLLIATALCSVGCKGKKVKQQEVVIYTSLDKVFSQPVLEAFEKQTGIKVLDVYDSEATKTTGLVNRLIAEKNAPKADVFWNSETGRTIVLKNKGVLAQYISPSAKDIPGQFRDREGYWTDFAARCRVLIYNKKLLKPDQLPKSIFELTEPKWKGKVALAYPLFGTTATHTAIPSKIVKSLNPFMLFTNLTKSLLNTAIHLSHFSLIVYYNGNIYRVSPYPLSKQKTGLFKAASSPLVTAVHLGGGLATQCLMQSLRK